MCGNPGSRRSGEQFLRVADGKNSAACDGALRSMATIIVSELNGE